MKFRQNLALLGLIIIGSMVATPNSAYANLNPPKSEVAAKIQAVFPDAPVMVAVAECESELRQFDEDGRPLKNPKSTATGALQLIASLHAADAKRMGYDIFTLEGNIAYAKVLYKRYGTKPWNPSKHCWKGKAPTITRLGQANLKGSPRTMDELF